MAENLPRYAVTDLIARVSGMSRGRLEMRLLGECAEVSRFMPPQTAGEGDMAFLTNAAYAEAMKASRASLLIMREQDVEALFGSDEPGRAVLVCDNPYAFFAFASQILFHVETPAGIYPRAFVEEGAEVDPSATVEALAVVRRGARVGARTVIKTGAVVGEDTVVGEDCILYPNCVLERGTVVGNRCIFQPGCDFPGVGIHNITGEHLIAHRYNLTVQIHSLLSGRRKKPSVCSGIVLLNISIYASVGFFKFLWG